MKSLVNAAVRTHRPWDVFRFLAHLPDFVRLFLALLFDRRVQPFPKLILMAAVVYAVSPLDFIPDLVPLAGELDDLTIFTLACRMFIQSCPRHVVDEHIVRIDRKGDWDPYGRREQLLVDGIRG